jgi:hypothetical protein
MADYTTAQLRAVGIPPASSDAASFPGPVVLEYDFDGAKRSTVATDTVAFFDIPALAGFIVRAASLTIVRPGTATGTADIQLAGTDVTGLTAWALDAAAGTQLIKLATAANTVVNAGSASTIRVQINTVGVGTGRFRVRVFGDMLAAASGAQ